MVGSVSNVNGWYTFLNYYFWMQAWVDAQVGAVIHGLAADPSWANTVIVFTADHGDYGGSHGLHDKGGALYDEALNVPLYISYPGMRKKYFVTGDNTSFSPLVPVLERRSFCVFLRNGAR